MTQTMSKHAAEDHEEFPYIVQARVAGIWSERRFSKLHEAQRDASAWRDSPVVVGGFEVRIFCIRRVATEDFLKGGCR